MKIKLFVAAFSLTLLQTFSAVADPVEGLLGSWTAQNFVQGRGVEFHMSFNFQEDTTQLTVKCYFYDGAFLEAQALTNAHYIDNEIYLQNSRQSVVDDGYHFCRATLQPSRWTAYFDGTGKMVLFVPTPYQSRFTLVRDI